MITAENLRTVYAAEPSLGRDAAELLRIESRYQSAFRLRGLHVCPFFCVQRMTDLETFLHASLTPRERLRAERLAQIVAERSERLRAGNYRRPLTLSRHHYETRRTAAEARARNLAPVLEDLRREGVTSLNGLARALTAKGIPTARGRAAWSGDAVSRVLARLRGLRGPSVHRLS